MWRVITLVEKLASWFRRWPCTFLNWFFFGLRRERLGVIWKFVIRSARGIYWLVFDDFLQVPVIEILKALNCCWSCRLLLKRGGQVAKWGHWFRASDIIFKVILRVWASEIITTRADASYWSSILIFADPQWIWQVFQWALGNLGLGSSLLLLFLSLPPTTWQCSAIVNHVGWNNGRLLLKWIWICFACR